jgi:predicted HTH domain antitoxin
MASVKIEIEEPLAAILHQTNQPVEQAGREMIVLELYRRRKISSGKAAELLGMQRIDFIQHASRLGIPYFALTAVGIRDGLPRVSVIVVVADASPLIALERIGQLDLLKALLEEKLAKPGSREAWHRCPPSPAE